jgi:hypothetical protein
LDEAGLSTLGPLCKAEQIGKGIEPRVIHMMACRSWPSYPISGHNICFGTGFRLLTDAGHIKTPTLALFFVKITYIDFLKVNITSKIILK